MGVWHVANNGGQLSLVDSTSNANNAANNGAISTAGKIDGGMKTNGSTYATIGTPANLANLAQGNATFSAWVNTASGVGGLIMGKDDPYDSAGWELDLNANNNFYFEVSQQDRDFVLTSPGTIGNGTWSYVVATLSGSPSKFQGAIYINGTPSIAGTGEGNWSGDDSAQTAYLGFANFVGYAAAYGWGSSGSLNGSEDEFRISNVVRSP